MKKSTIFVVMVLLLSVLVPALCEESIDLGCMTVEQLTLLRDRINAELVTRPEAETRVLDVGGYIVGKDLQPGTYYAIYAYGTWSGGGIYIYSNEAKDNQLIRIYTLPSNYEVYILRDLEMGNLVVVDNNAVFINMTGFPEYQPHAGTTVPVGIYEAGMEIPVGKYSAYLNDGKSTVKIYKDRKTYETAEYSWDALYSQTLGYTTRELNNLQLNEGNILLIEDHSVIMTKSSLALEFD